VLDLYARGEGKGESTGLGSVDKIYTIVPGQVTVVTGVPSSGKSEFIDHVMCSMAEASGWRFAVCSFENPPATHIVKLVEKYGRSPFYKHATGRMHEPEIKRCLSWVGDHFYWIEQADGAASNIDDIIERAKVAVMRHGVRGVVIDPYNYIDKPRDMAETEYVSELLTKIKQFAVGHDVHVWFVAHPTKLKRDETGRIPAPGGYEISGSSAWYAKADCGLTVHRGLEENLTEIHLWKVRFKWVGRQGMVMLAYDPTTGRYSDGRTSGLQATASNPQASGGEAWWTKQESA
jgi:twinkle protein